MKHQKNKSKHDEYEHIKIGKIINRSKPCNNQIKTKIYIEMKNPNKKTTLV